MIVRRIVLWAVIACLSLSAPCQDGGQPARDAKSQDAAGQKAAEHDHLALFAGEWDIKLTMRMGPEPVTVQATASEKVVFGGLYLLMLVSGEMGGKPFEGRAVTAYDRHAKEFVSVWVDSDSNRPSFSRGSFDPKTRTMTMTGDMKTPAGMMKTRTLTTIREDGSRTEVVHGKGPDGAEKVVMEFDFTRRKEAAPLKPAPVDPKGAPEDIAKLAGNWSASLSMTQKAASGDVPVGTSAATESCQLICGGKWLWTEMESDFGGEKHLGSALIGFDPESKRYSAVWWDNHGGTFDVAEGTSDGKIRSMEGTTYDDAGKRIKWWETSAWKDADHRSLTWKVAATETQPMMQIDATYSRVK